MEAWLFCQKKPHELWNLGAEHREKSETIGQYYIIHENMYIYHDVVSSHDTLSRAPSGKARLSGCLPWMTPSLFGDRQVNVILFSPIVERIPTLQTLNSLELMCWVVFNVTGMQSYKLTLPFVSAQARSSLAPPFAVSELSSQATSLDCAP